MNKENATKAAICEEVTLNTGCNATPKILGIMYIKTPPKSKSNPRANDGNMGIFFKQKLAPKHFEAAIKSGQIFIET